MPDNAFSSQGLATPWQLGGGCHESNVNQAVFVQGVIFNPATKTFEAYSPLVTDAGTAPAISPTPPVLPSGAVVALFGGGNDDATSLTGAASQCVNGADNKIFGQVFFCNTQKFFAVVNAAGVVVPSLGLDSHGQICPTVRDFRIVDQDQSDNVQTTYLVTSTGQTAQDTAANRAVLGTFTVRGNPSDNSLLTKSVDPAIGCAPWKAPDLANNNNPVLLQALDELQAARFQANPVALIPSGDPMTGPNVLDMVNAYRAGVDQPLVHTLGQANTQAYCAHLKNAAPGFIASWKSVFETKTSPVPGVNLYDFMLNRFHQSLVLLGCKNAA